jgi:hypothetical protein
MNKLYFKATLCALTLWSDTPAWGSAPWGSLDVGAYESAKTGSMSGINCLCGYNDGTNPKAFVFMANSFAPPVKELWDVMDHFITSNLEE